MRRVAANLFEPCVALDTRSTKRRISRRTFACDQGQVMWSVIQFADRNVDYANNV